ncbi:hypothetical protein B7494_g4517 [Chlorociboria aeruginascens]|nr:hypothetical protein B7494_g4517 [Chlorociboria aeruginascens]
MYEFMFQVVEHATAAGKSVAVLFLSYDLAPAAIYPRQLQQAASLLNHVLNTLSIPPSRLLLSGDSAGGNLACALLSHISHPHPSTSVRIPAVQLPEPFRAAVLVSPWISFSLREPSFATNARRDCLTTRAGTQWSEAFLACAYPHDGVRDSYNEAGVAPVAWWAHLPARRVLVVAGEEEVLVDGIREFVGKLQRGVQEGEAQRGWAVEMTYFEAVGEYHDQPNIDFEIGYKGGKDECEQAKMIKDFVVGNI